MNGCVCNGTIDHVQKGHYIGEKGDDGINIFFMHFFVQGR